MDKLFLISFDDPAMWRGLFALAAVLVALLAVVIGLGVHFGYSVYREKRYLLTIQRETSTVRFYRVNRMDDQVTYFNLSDMADVKTSTCAQFYASFPASERERLSTWVDDLLDGKVTPDYLELDVYIGKRRNRQLVPSFLKTTGLDLPKGTLHLESYLLSGLAPNSSSSGQHLSTESEFAEALKSNGYANGFTFCFSFFPKKGGKSKGHPKVGKDLSSRFRALISPYVKGSQRLIQCSESEFLVANFDMSEKSEAIDFALRSGKGIDALLITTRKKREPLYECRIGIVINRDLPGDADAIVAESRSAALSAREAGIGFEFFDKDKEPLAKVDEIGVFKNEVDRIIEDRRIAFSYRPVYAVARRFVYAYLAEARPVNTSFATIDELKNYARRAMDDKNLFAHIAKTLVNRFVAQRELKSQKLVYPVRYDELGLIQSFFPRYRSAKDANVVFLFKEEDCAQSIGPGGLDDFLLALSSLKDKGFQIAFLLAGNSLSLNPSCYQLADAFYVDFQKAAGPHMDSLVRTQLHALVEKLLRYKKPIVAMNLINWMALELVVGSGIDYISSDCFAPFDANLRPIGPKNIQRIQALRERK